MARKREQRLRRKARAQVRAAERRVEQLAPLAAIARAAVAYINEIDAPNLREPWAIANRRRELAAVVHAHQQGKRSSKSFPSPRRRVA